MNMVELNELIRMCSEKFHEVEDNTYHELLQYAGVKSPAYLKDHGYELKTSNGGHMRRIYSLYHDDKHKVTYIVEGKFRDNAFKVHRERLVNQLEDLSDVQY